jgi:hypothetical protein
MPGLKLAQRMANPRLVRFWRIAERTVQAAAMRMLWPVRE